MGEPGDKESDGEVRLTVDTALGRQRIRKCLDGASRDNFFYQLLLEACDILDRKGIESPKG